MNICCDISPAFFFFLFAHFSCLFIYFFYFLLCFILFSYFNMAAFRFNEERCKHRKKKLQTENNKKPNKIQIPIYF